MRWALHLELKTHDFLKNRTEKQQRANTTRLLNILLWSTEGFEDSVARVFWHFWLNSQRQKMSKEKNKSREIQRAASQNHKLFLGLHTYCQAYLNIYHIQHCFWLYLVRKGVKDSPEEFLGEEELLLGGSAIAAHTWRQAVVLPVLLIVVGQKLEMRDDRGIKINIIPDYVNVV